MKDLKQIELLKILIVGVKTFFVLLFFFVLSVLLIFLYYSYETICFQLLSFYGKADKLAIFKTSYLTPSRFDLIKYVATIALGLAILILVNLNSVASRVASGFFSFFQSWQKFVLDLIQDFKLLPSSQKWLALAVLIVVAVLKYYFIDRYYFHIDEVFSYLFFVKKGFWVIISYYPGPNNHILYSLLAYFLQPFFSNPYYLMKIPSLVASLVAASAFFLFLLRYASFYMALLCALLFSCTPNFFYYSLFGRGYVLVTMLVIFSFFMVLKIMEGNREKYVWHLYACFSILGFYSMIIFLYPYVSFCLAILIWSFYRKDQALLKTFVYYNLLVGAGTFILYLPLLLISGLSSLTSNPWIIRFPMQEFLQNFPALVKGIVGYILSIEQGACWIGFPVLIISGIIMIRKQQYPWLLLIASLFIAPLAVLLIQRVQPYDRVWTYLIFPFSLCVWIILDFIFSWMHIVLLKKIIQLSLCMTIIIAAFFHFYEDTLHGHQIYDEIGRICKYVVKDGDGKVFTNEDVYNIYLRYEASRAGSTMVPAMSVDTAEQQFSYVLLIPHSNFPALLDRKKYMLKEQNEYIEVYQNISIKELSRLRK